MAETELIYRIYILEPRYTEAILQIAYSHRFSRDYEFLGIEKFDAIGRNIKIICYLVHIIYLLP